MTTTRQTTVGDFCLDVNWKLVEEYAREELVFKYPSSSYINRGLSFCQEILNLRSSRFFSYFLASRDECPGS